MGKHLQIEDRIKIQTMLEVGKTVDDVAIYLGRHRSTIYREVSRAGVLSSKYDASIYHSQARANMIRSQEDTYPQIQTIGLIEQKIIEEQWSPEQISQWLKLHNYESVSHTWIYQYIKKDKLEGGELQNHLRIGSYSKGPIEYRGKIQNRVSIEERPEIVKTRSRLGDYEVDLIVGPKNKGAILTVIDRASRECMIKKLQNKSATEVEFVLSKAITGIAYTITSDNGTEFSNHLNIAKKIDIKYYFANPYASYERGSIENLNGLIRQYIPKGSGFDEITQDDLDLIQDKLNNRPRKTLEFLTPIEYRNNYNASRMQ